MAAMHEEEVPDAKECGKIRTKSRLYIVASPRCGMVGMTKSFVLLGAANCGAVDDLLLCSRCHTAWFCGPKCQKAS